MAFDPSRYGDGLADIYDLVYPATPEVGQAVDFLNDHCPEKGDILELGVGTGRLALPLAELGHRVHGVDASQKMLDKLAESDPDGTVETTLADFADIRLDRKFDVVLIALNTFFMLPSQELQIACLANARNHLKEGGKVIIEVYEPSRFHAIEGTDTQIQHLDSESVMINSIQVDRINQIVAIGQILFRSGEMQKTPEISRYAWPAELDLMARIAGLTPSERHENWLRHPFTQASPRHVSVFTNDG